jgi:lipooligosaccharide transport system permease protein
MIQTPQGVRDIVLGHMYWLIVRLAIVTGVFLVVSFLFGAITAPTAILAWPAAILTGVAFGMAMAAWTASRKTEQSFAFVFRFIITPLFLFSGTFFPIEQLPDALEWIAWLTPLFHGVALARGLAIGHLEDPAVMLIHVTYLLAFASIGIAFAFRTFRSRLIV